MSTDIARTQSYALYYGNAWVDIIKTDVMESAIDI